MLLTLTIEPFTFASSSTAAFAIRVGPMTWISKMSSISARSADASDPRSNLPALLTTTSTRPERSTAMDTAAEATSASVTSPARMAILSLSPLTSSRRSSRRPTTSTSAPSLANASATPRPIPVPPPVTITDLLANLICSLTGSHPRSALRADRDSVDLCR